MLGYESFEKEMGCWRERGGMVQEEQISLMARCCWTTGGHLDATDPLIVRNYIQPGPLMAIARR